MEAVQQDLTCQPAGANKELRMEARSGCAMKGDANRRRCDKRRRENQLADRGKQKERHQWTRGGRGLVGRGCGRGRVKRMKGGCVDTTTIRQTRDNHWLAKVKVTAMVTENAVPSPSRDLVTTALVLAAEALAVLKVVMATAAAMVLAAEAAAALKSYDSNGGDIGIAIFGGTSLAARGGVIN